jgi:hypothetical protein
MNFICEIFIHNNLIIHYYMWNIIKCIIFEDCGVVNPKSLFYCMGWQVPNLYFIVWGGTSPKSLFYCIYYYKYIDNIFSKKNIKIGVATSKFYIYFEKNNITTEVKTLKNLQFRDFHQISFYFSLYRHFYTDFLFRLLALTCRFPRKHHVEVVWFASPPFYRTIYVFVRY